MATQKRSELKKYFETGDTPSSEDFSNLIDSTINKMDDAIFVKSKDVGLGTTSPKNKLDVAGGMIVGSDYAGNNKAPINGLLVQGSMSLGTTTPKEMLTVNGAIAINQSISNSNEENYARLWVEEEQQYCLQFNGEDDFLDLSEHISSFESINQGTISLWYKPSLENFQTQNLLYYGDGRTNNNLLEISIGSSSEDFEDESLVVRIRANGETKLRMFMQQGENYFSEDRWHHIVIVLSKKYNKVYVDGDSMELNYQVQDENASSWFFNLPAKELVNNFVIGKKMVNDAEMSFLNGCINELAIWGDRLLSDQDVRRLANLGPDCRLDNYYLNQIIGYWRMGDDEGSVETSDHVTDISGNEIHARVEGAQFTGIKSAQLRFKDTYGNETKLSEQKFEPSGLQWNHQGEHLYFNSGNIGVGIAEPSEQLHVSSKIRIGNTQIYDNEINRYNNDALHIGYRNTAHTILQANGGAVGIGMTPGATLDVNGTTRSRLLIFHGNGGDSGQAHEHYGIYQEQGGWAHPYPDLILNYHTGIKYVAYHGYNGHRFYTGYSPDATPTTEALSIGDGDHNVRVKHDLYVDGNVYVRGTLYKQSGTPPIVWNQEYSPNGYNFYSDSRLKEKISKIKNPLNGILALDGIRFKWKSGLEKLGIMSTPSYGVLAQDVEKIFPELIRKKEGYKTVNYNGLIGVLIEAIKEWSSRNHKG